MAPYTSSLILNRRFSLLCLALALIFACAQQVKAAELSGTVLETMDASGYTYMRTTESADSLQGFSEAQGVMLNYNDDGQLPAAKEHYTQEDRQRVGVQRQHRKDRDNAGPGPQHQV